MSSAQLPEVPWLAPAENPWGVPVLDVRPVASHSGTPSK